MGGLKLMKVLKQRGLKSQGLLFPTMAILFSKK